MLNILTAIFKGSKFVSFLVEDFFYNLNVAVIVCAVLYMLTSV